MTAKSADRRKPSRRAPVQEVAADSLVVRLADRVFENPAMSGGLVVMALTAGAIVSNAMFLQRAHHPQPLFMTRPTAASTAPAPVVVPNPRPRIAQPASAVPPKDTAMPPIPQQKPIVAALQRELAGKGYYVGAVDGVAGPGTRTAISAYQHANGLPVTGEPSGAILDRIRTASIKAAAKPAAQSAPVATAAKVAPDAPAESVAAAASETEVAVLPASAVPTQPAKVAMAPAADPAPVTAAPAAAAGSDQAAPPIESVIASNAEPLPVPAAKSTAPVTAKAAAKPDPAAAAATARYAAVQHALNQIGYGPVAEAGTPDDVTRDAIRHFELDNGLPITGAPDDHVVNRLIAIGAMEAT